MDLQVLMAAHAEKVGREIVANGVGANIMTGQRPTSLIFIFDATGPDIGKQHRLRMDLVDADGESVMRPDGTGPLVQGDLKFQVTSDSEAPDGVPVRSTHVQQIPPLKLEPGHYQWRVWINNDTEESWAADFYVR